MKLFELHRLNAKLAIKVVIAYIGAKVFRLQLVKNQDKLIAYFNHLTVLNMHHKKTLANHFLVASPSYGRFYLRKPYSSDYKVYEQVFLNKEYLRLAELIQENCEGDTISMIDGGANIGFTSIYISDYFKGKKKIRSILVEPFEDNIVTAKLNVDAHGMDSVFYEQAGIHNKKCFLRTDQQFRDGMEWSIQIVESDQSTNLPSIEISDVLEKYQIDTLDVLKLDIEGAERFLFEDEEYATSFLTKVKIIAIELHDEYHIADAILDIIRKNNFDLVKFGEMYVGAKRENSRNPDLIIQNSEF